MKAVCSLVTKLLILSFCLMVSPVARAQVASDSILSRHIKEGDNLGQDTNSGNGIKTGHINNGAVTNAKLAPGAVTSDKIAGQLPASLIDRTGLDADLLDGYHASAFAAASHSHTQYRAKNSRIIVVAADGSGDYTSVDAAVAAIADASATNPYLVKIGPGDYQVPAFWNPKNYVDIEGSGRGITRIWAACPAQNVGPSLMTISDVVAEIRDVTLEIVGGGTGSRYLALDIQASSLRLSRVAIVCGASGGGTCDNAVTVGYGAQVELVDSTIHAPVRGVFLRSQPGYTSVPSILWMRGGTVDAPVGGLAVASPTNEITAFYGAGVQLTGPFVAPGDVAPATLKCLSCFNAGFDPIAP